MTAIGHLPQRATSLSSSSGTDVAHAMSGRRQVYFTGRGSVDCVCYARAWLAPGMRFDGPALVDQEDATTLVAPGFQARVDATLNIILERS